MWVKLLKIKYLGILLYLGERRAFFFFFFSPRRGLHGREMRPVYQKTYIYITY